MSQENMEIVRLAYEAWNRDDIDAMLTFFHDDIEYFPAEEGGIIHGHDALRRYWERFMEAWDEFHMGPTEFMDAGDHVFNKVAMNGRGAWQRSRSRDGVLAGMAHPWRQSRSLRGVREPQ